MKHSFRTRSHTHTYRHSLLSRMSALIGLVLAIPFFVLAVFMRVRVFGDHPRTYKKSMAASAPNMSAAVLDSCLARFWVANMPMLFTARPGAVGRTCGPSS